MKFLSLFKDKKGAPTPVPPVQYPRRGTPAPVPKARIEQPR